MDNDYFSIDAILAENQVCQDLGPQSNSNWVWQKIQCTFKVDIPDMGHLGGGNERDVLFTRLSPL